MRLPERMVTAGVKLPCRSSRIPDHFRSLAGSARGGSEAIECLNRHGNGDWGELSNQDKRENDLSLRMSFRLPAAYKAS